MSDAELNRFVAERVMGWHYYPGIGTTMSVAIWRGDDGTGYVADHYKPSTDIAQAMEAMVRSDHYWVMSRGEGVRIKGREGESLAQVFHDNTAPGIARAICEALHKALEEDDNAD